MKMHSSKGTFASSPSLLFIETNEENKNREINKLGVSAHHQMSAFVEDIFFHLNIEVFFDKHRRKARCAERKDEGKTAKTTTKSSKLSKKGWSKRAERS